MPRDKRKRLQIEPDHGPPERYQHGDVIVDSPTETAGVQAKRVMTQTALDRYHARGEIRPRQYDAGVRLYRLWYAAGRSPVVTGKLISLGGRDDQAEARKADALVDYNAAIQAVGLRLSAVLVDVCLCDTSASGWARRNGHHPKSGIALLRLALDTLGDHFGLARDPKSDM